MLPLQEMEVWMSRFAKRLQEEQPRIDRALALETAQVMWEGLRMLPPEGAVQVFLEIQLSAHLAAQGQSADGEGRPSSSA